MAKVTSQLESAERKIQKLENDWQSSTEEIKTIGTQQGSLSNQQTEIRIKQTEFENLIKDKITLAECNKMLETKQYLHSNDAVFYRTYLLLYHKFRNMVIFRSGNLDSLCSRETSTISKLFIC